MEEFLAWLVATLKNIGIKSLAAIAVLALGSAVIKFVLRRFRQGKTYERLDPTVRSFLHSFISIALWVLLIVCIVAILGVPMASVTAAIASAGVAIGLALQGSLANLAGGIMLLIFRPFEIGDYIETEGGSGTVRELGIFYTMLCTPDNKHITIPNGTLMNTAITNYSREKTRRVDVAVAVPHDADLRGAAELAKRIAEENKLVLPEPKVFAKITDIGDSYATLTVRVWVNNGDFWTVKHDLISSLREGFDLAEIKIPHNTMDISVKTPEPIKEQNTKK